MSQTQASLIMRYAELALASSRKKVEAPQSSQPPDSKYEIEMRDIREKLGMNHEHIMELAVTNLIEDKGCGH